MCVIDWSAIAAWVQAIFTILALWITQRIATSNDRKRRNEIFMAANAFASQLIASVATLRQFSQQNRRQEVFTQSYVLNEISFLGRSIAIELLPAEIASRFFKLRAIAAEATALIEEIRYKPINDDITRFMDLFEALRVRAHDDSVGMNID